MSSERLSSLGARLGNWNDDRHGDDNLPKFQQSVVWKALDRVAGWLYTLPDRRNRG